AKPTTAHTTAWAYVSRPPAFAHRPRSRLMSIMSDPSSPSAARTVVVAAALELFARQGFEATSVEQIAQAAGVSRSTFFRQFGGKEDVVFADHEVLIEELREWFTAGHDDPWVAVCEASERVFAHFAREVDVARRRYQIVRQVPA